MIKAVKKFNGEMFDLYLGSVGQGKTLVINEDYTLPALIDRQEVFCSYWVNWNRPNYHYWREPEEFTELKNCLLVIDELGDIIDKWSWDILDASIKKFFMYHRHRLVDIVGNTQDYGDVAVQPRRHITRYFMTEKHFSNKFIQKFWKSFPWVVIKTYEMTKNDVMLLDKPIITNDNNETVDTFKSIDKLRTFYSIKKLYHFELDKFKKEFIHFYCPDCGCRHNEDIPKDETGQFAIRDKKTNLFIPREDYNFPYCPKHIDTKLTIRTSTMYDSHYLPKNKSKQVVVKLFSKAEKLVPYKGNISDEQRELIKNLKDKF